MMASEWQYLEDQKALARLVASRPTGCTCESARPGDHADWCKLNDPDSEIGYEDHGAGCTCMDCPGAFDVGPWIGRTR